MAEDRMLNDEILLGLIKKNGGSGGTTDYEALENLPEINSVELKGNKSLADLGIASATTVSGILDGASIDSFADVETALDGKQDTLTFDNMPTENSTNPVKSGGIYSALAGKADTGIVADDFDSTASYVIGNYCIENGKLYRFKANHSGAWSASDVDEIQITGELATLQSGLINHTSVSCGMGAFTKDIDLSAYTGKIVMINVYSDTATNHLTAACIVAVPEYGGGARIIASNVTDSYITFSVTNQVLTITSQGGYSYGVYAALTIV